MNIVNQEILFPRSPKRIHLKTLSKKSFIEVNFSRTYVHESFPPRHRGWEVGFHLPQPEKTFKSVGNFHFSKLTIPSKGRNRIYVIILT